MLDTERLTEAVAVDETLALRETDGECEALGDPDVVTDTVLEFEKSAEREPDTDTVVVFDPGADRVDLTEAVAVVEFLGDALVLTVADDEFDPVMDRVCVAATLPERVALPLTDELDVGELVREMVGDALVDPDCDAEPDADMVELADTGAVVPVFVPLALPERLALPESDAERRTEPVGVVDSVMLRDGSGDADGITLPVCDSVTSGERVDVDETLALTETRGLPLGDVEVLGLRETATLREADAVDELVLELVVVPLGDPDALRVLVAVTVPVFVLVCVRDVVVVDDLDANAVRDSSGLRDSSTLRDSVDDTLADRLARGDTVGEWLVDGDRNDRLADALLTGDAESPPFEERDAATERDSSGLRVPDGDAAGDRLPLPDRDGDAVVDGDRSGERDPVTDAVTDGDGVDDADDDTDAEPEPVTDSDASTLPVIERVGVEDGVRVETNTCGDAEPVRVFDALGVAPE